MGCRSKQREYRGGGVTCLGWMGWKGGAESIGDAVQVEGEGAGSLSGW